MKLLAGSITLLLILLLFSVIISLAVHPLLSNKIPWYTLTFGETLALQFAIQLSLLSVWLHIIVILNMKK